MKPLGSALPTTQKILAGRAWILSELTQALNFIGREVSLPIHPSCSDGEAGRASTAVCGIADGTRSGALPGAVESIPPDQGLGSIQICRFLVEDSQRIRHHRTNVSPDQDVVMPAITPQYSACIY